MKMSDSCKIYHVKFKYDIIPDISITGYSVDFPDFFFIIPRLYIRFCQEKYCGWAALSLTNNRRVRGSNPMGDD